MGRTLGSLSAWSWKLRSLLPAACVNILDVTLGDMEPCRYFVFFGFLDIRIRSARASDLLCVIDSDRNLVLPLTSSRQMQAPPAKLLFKTFQNSNPQPVAMEEDSGALAHACDATTGGVFGGDKTGASNLGCWRSRHGLSNPTSGGFAAICPRFGVWLKSGGRQRHPGLQPFFPHVVGRFCMRLATRQKSWRLKTLKAFDIVTLGYLCNALTRRGCRRRPARHLVQHLRVRIAYTSTRSDEMCSRPISST